MKSKEFNALILDASTDNLYVIVLKKGEIFGGKSCDCLKKHSETIMTEIDRVLKESGLMLSDIDAFVCGVGCGSFTGAARCDKHGQGLERAAWKKTCSRQHSGSCRIQ